MANGQAIDNQDFPGFCDVLPDPQECVVPDLRGEIIRGARSPTATLSECSGNDTLKLDCDIETVKLCIFVVTFVATYW